MTPSAGRFMLVVCGPPAGTWFVAALLVVYGVYIERRTPDFFGQVLAITMFLQLFAASTGFRTPLRRGHFDPLLVQSPNRWRVAAAHWIVSIGPGAMVWIALAAIEFAGNPRRTPVGVAPAVLVMFVYVSTVVWAVSAIVGRLSGAVIWVVMLVVLNLSGSMGWFQVSFIGRPATLGDTARSIASVLVVPVSLAIEPRAVGVKMLALVSAAAALVWVAAAASMQRCDAPLVQS